VSELTKTRRTEGLLAALLLFGPFLLAIPGPLGPLHRAFAAVELTGTGIIALAALPVAWLVVLRPSKRATLGSYLVIALWLASVLSAELNQATDTLERDRALILLVVGVVLCSCAAGLREVGRTILGKLLCLLSLLLLIPPLAEAGLGAARLLLNDGDPGDAVATLAGVLGNTGELSNAALPGALFGVLLASMAMGPWPALGAMAAGSLLIHAAFAPALTTLAAAVIIGLLAAASSHLNNLPQQRTRAPLVFAAIALALAGGRLALRALPSGPADAVPPAAVAADSAAGSDFGGLKVRELIARSSVEALRDAPLLGHGTGQFVVAFPPYRALNPQEIELSSHGRTIGAESEVEHPHSDLLLVLVETGWLGGLCFLLMLLHALTSIRRALSRGDDTDAGLALGLGALIIASFLHAPLLHHPLTSALGFMLLGSISTPLAQSPLRGSRWYGLALAVLLSFYAKPALDISRHGSALAELATTELTSSQQHEIVDRMLRARPDSVIARTRRALLLDFEGRTTRERLDAWGAVGELREHRIVPHIQSGILLARDGQLGRAREHFAAARAIDPHNPEVLRRLAVIELFSARIVAGEELIDELSKLGHMDHLWRLSLSADLLLTGMHEEALAVLSRCQPRLRDLTGPWDFYNLAKEEYRPKSGDAFQKRVADALECTAHRLWAREHAEGGDWDAALISFHQAARFARREDLSLPPRFELESAAILWKCKRPIDARDALKRAGDDAIAWRGLPVWAGEALMELKRSDAGD